MISIIVSTIAAAAGNAIARSNPTAKPEVEPVPAKPSATWPIVLFVLLESLVFAAPLGLLAYAAVKLAFAAQGETFP